MRIPSFKQCFRIISKNYISLLSIVIILLLVSIYTISCIPSALGEFFFGRYPQLYNVTFAEFFFDKAAHPLLGVPAPYAFHQLSRTHFIQGDLEKALIEAKEELVQYPDHKATYYILGLTYGYLNREEEAIKAFSSYIEYNPKTWAGRNDMAWLQFRTGDIVGALDTISPAYEMYPNNPWVLNTYGVILMNLGVYDEAKKILQAGSMLADALTEEEWGKGYPGNDPSIYKAGLSAMRISFKENINTLEGKMLHVDKKKN